MPRFPHRPGSAGARPRQGRSSSGLTALRGLHLDSACAPAVTWQLAEAGQGKIKPISECPRFEGNPEPAARISRTCGVETVSPGIRMSDARRRTAWPPWLVDVIA